ncbi:MAG: penicillin acylase family protein, partial [Vicinamibacterales bacterium]
MTRLFLFGLALAAALAASGWGWTRASLPPLDGETTVPGLHRPVEVLFDGWAVPHVYARDPEDAWFAAGVLHARDRAWQMELYRRVTMGRLAEVLGEEALPVDRRFLTLGLRARAASAWAATSPQARVALERYAAGVNAVFAATSGWRRPPEFQALGVDPAPWSPLDSLAVAELLAWRLAENHQAELVRFALARRFGDAAATRLAGRYPASAPAVMPAAVPGVAGRAPAGPPSRGGAVDVVARAGAGAAPVAYPRGLEWLEPSAPRVNSNNWVLAGSRTASRRPILANDPHLAIEMPSTWYELHLVAAGLDVTGVSVPGSPFVVIGHNQRVAWGCSNTGADVQDLSLVR